MHAKARVSFKNVFIDDLRADSPNDAGRTPEEETKKDDSSFGEAMDCSPPGPQGGGGECDAGDVEMGKTAFILIKLLESIENRIRLIPQKRMKTGTKRKSNQKK